MKNKNKKAIMAVVALAIVLVTVATTYAFITFVIEGKKTNTITGGSLVVSLDESANSAGDITIANAFPVSDSVGKQSTAYKFSLVNQSVKDVNYTISLAPQAVNPGFEIIPNTALKVYLTDGTDAQVIKNVTLISNLGNNVLATGVIPAKKGATNTVLDFNLRLWIADTATDKDVWTVVNNEDGTQTTTGKQYAAKISVEAVQVAEYAVSVVNGAEIKNMPVFLNGTATFNLTFGTGTPTVTCQNSAGSSVTAKLEGSTLTVSNITDHTTCSVTYTQ